MRIKRIQGKMVRMILVMIQTIFLFYIGFSKISEMNADNEVIAKEADQESAGFDGELYAKSAVLIDGDTGRLLYGKEAYVPRPMASTTKIMTCIVALEEMTSEDEIAIASEAAVRQPKVHLGVKAGEQFYLKDLLYSLMLESHNDSAVMIAEAIGGSVEDFVRLMNEKAKQLGCEHTYFITPNGLDAADNNGVHQTTAYELARIMKYCTKDSPKKDAFLAITQCKSYAFQDVEKTDSYQCFNHNAFLDQMDGVISGKTGFTGDAGYCYVCALERNGKCLIVALLACGWPNNRSYKWTDTKALMEYGLNHYEKKDLWEDPKLPKLSVENGIPEGDFKKEKAEVTLSVQDVPEEWKMLLGEHEIIRRQIYLKKKLKAPVKKGEKVGEIRYQLNDESIKSFSIVTDNSIKKIDYWYCVRYLIQNATNIKIYQYK